MSDFSQSESTVRQMIQDVSNKTDLGITLRDFAAKLTEMHRELVDKEGQYLIMPGQANQITAEYAESFIWSVIKTIERKQGSDEMIVNGNVNTKCSQSDDGKHKFESYSISGVPKCDNCGILVDKY